MIYRVAWMQKLVQIQIGNNVTQVTRCFFLLFLIGSQVLLVKCQQSINVVNDNSNSNACSSKLLNDYTRIPDIAFSSTSHFVNSEKLDFSAKAARMSYDSENRRFAWCPRNQVETSLVEYLEIDLGRLTLLNVVQTKGRFAEGAGKEFTPYYQIKYLREIWSDETGNHEYDNNWRDYVKLQDDNSKSSILNGPTDSYVDKFETLDPPIIAKRIRIFPYSPQKAKRICLKVQLFGCDYKYNLLEYSMPQGSLMYPNNISYNPNLIHYRRSTSRAFHDQIYDGQSTNEHNSYSQYLSHGLGLLTDGIVGDNLNNDIITNIHSAISDRSSPVNHYVGWDRSQIAGSSDSVTIKFIFQQQRNFSNIRIYSTRNSHFKINYFSKLELYFFCGNSHKYKSRMKVSDTIKRFNHSHNFIDINVEGKCGKIVTMKLYFSNFWLLLSEVAFMSKPINDMNTNKNNSQKTNTEIKNPKLLRPDQSSTTPQILSKFLNISTNKPTESNGIEAIYLLTILLCALVGLVTAICSFWLILFRRRSARKHSIKKHALALCSNNMQHPHPFHTTSPTSGAFIIPYNQPPISTNHNSSSLQCLSGANLPPSQNQPPPPIPPTQSQSNHHLSNYPVFTTERLNYSNGTVRSIGGFINSSNTNTGLDANQLLLKHSNNLDNNIYTSIMGSDNDSILSPEYASTSVTNDISINNTSNNNNRAAAIQSERTSPTQTYLPPPLEPLRQQQQQQQQQLQHHILCNAVNAKDNEFDSTNPPESHIWSLALPPPQSSATATSNINTHQFHYNNPSHLHHHMPHHIPYQLSFNDFTQDLSTINPRNHYHQNSLDPHRLDSYI